MGCRTSCLPTSRTVSDSQRKPVHFSLDGCCPFRCALPVSFLSACRHSITNEPPVISLQVAEKPPFILPQWSLRSAAVPAALRGAGGHEKGPRLRSPLIYLWLYRRSARTGTTASTFHRISSSIAFHLSVSIIFDHPFRDGSRSGDDERIPDAGASRKGYPLKHTVFALKCRIFAYLPAANAAAPAPAMRPQP